MNNSRRIFLRKTGTSLLGSMLGAQYINASGRNIMPNMQNQSYTAQSNNEIIEETDEAIKKHRMDDVEIELLSPEGKPIKNTPVEIILKKHHFLFGDNNVMMDTMIRGGKAYEEKLEYCRDIFKEIFNAINITCYWTERPKNNMAKTEDFQGKKKIEGFDETASWALANGLYTKGHPLFWTVPKAIPDWLEDYPYQTQMKFVEVRV